MMEVQKERGFGEELTVFPKLPSVDEKLNSEVLLLTIFIHVASRCVPEYNRKWDVITSRQVKREVRGKERDQLHRQEHHPEEFIRARFVHV